MRYNPFNSQRPAKPEYFVGRELEINQFIKYLSQTMYNSPMNMCITGNRGIGKTSILLKLMQLAENEKCLVFYMSNYEGNVKNILELSDYLITGIKQNLYEKTPMEGKISKFGEWIKTLRPIISYGEISVSVSVEERKHIAENILRNNLENIWKKVSGEYSAIILLIDEAEALDRIEGGLSFLREVFQRLSQDANYMIVLCGKLNFSERMSESFSPLCRFFPTYSLNYFSEKETNDFIDKTLQSVKVTIDRSVKTAVFEMSKGHPYVAVKMCELTFDELGECENNITIDHFNKAFPKILKELRRDFFYPIYHPLSPRAKEIIVKLSELNKVKFDFKDAVRKTGMKRTHLSPYIQELVRKGCLNKPERAKYEFFHELFINFLKECKEDAS